MNILQMKYFITVADERNFTRAAEKLFVSQPAVSKQIAALEREIGAPLLERKKRSSVGLTEEGERFYALYKDFLEHHDKLIHEIAINRGLKPICIGIAEGWNIPTLIRDCLSAHADVQWQTRSFHDLATCLQSGEIDMAISMMDTNIQNIQSLDVIPLTTVKGIFLFSSGHRKQGADYSVSDLEGDTLLLLETPEGAPVDKTRLMHVLGSDPEVRFCPNRDSILFGLEHGNTFTLMDEWIRYIKYPDYAFIYSGTAAPVCIIMRKDADPHIKRIAEIVRAQTESASGHFNTSTD